MCSAGCALVTDTWARIARTIKEKEKVRAKEKAKEKEKGFKEKEKALKVKAKAKARSTDWTTELLQISLGSLAGLAEAGA